MKKSICFCLCICSMVCCAFAQTPTWRTISGEYYDWTKTGKPEQPYAHEYHQCLSLHLLLATPDGKGGSYVRYTFEEALSLIKQTDALTRHIPKIIYLAGWQYTGHDDLYPAWHQVNNALKRPCDGTGRESLLWLYEEAKKYNTVVSLHVNMANAYNNSPLWDTYLSEGLISRMKNGDLMKIGVYNGLDCYQISFKQEWEKGYSVKRINELIELLPFLKEAGTILLDAYFSLENQYLGISQQTEESYQRRVIRYFKSLGIDVVQESYSRLREGKDHFDGLSPWFAWLDQTEEGYLKTPAYIATGAGPYRIAPQMPDVAAAEMQLGFLFGMSTRGLDCYNDLENDSKNNPDWHKCFKYQFYTGTLPYIYLNRYQREKLTGEGLQRAVSYSDDLVVSLKDSLITHHGRVLRQGNNLFLPATWNRGREILAYSQTGYASKQWDLPADWSDVREVDLYLVDEAGMRFVTTKPVVTGRVELSLQAGEALSVFPAKGKARP